MFVVCILQDDNSQFSCMTCAPSCAECADASSCDDDVSASRVILLALQVFLMTGSFVSGVAVVRLRKSKVLNLNVHDSLYSHKLQAEL
jgi:hypothetical protein